MFRYLVLVFVLLGWNAAAQTPCSFIVSPGSANFSSAGGNGFTNVTANSSTCRRTASSNVPWITISYGQDGTGNGQVGYTVQANPTSSARTGTLTIAGQTFTVTQQAGTCQFNLTPNRVTVSPLGGTGSFEVDSGCTWSATTTSTWITITAVTNNSVTYSVSANTSGSERTGTINVGNTTFTIVQSGNCVLTLNQSAVAVAAIGGNGTVNVTASQSTCEWAVRSEATWITITSAASGRGNGTVTFTAVANNSGAFRTGRILIGETSLTVTQQHSTCSVLASPTQAEYGPNGGTGTIGVNANCGWTATSLTDWITITSAATQTGSRTVTYTVSSNFGVAPRTGLIDISGTQVIINQRGLPQTCELGIQPVLLPNYPPEGARQDIDVSSSCTWQASSLNEWITLSGTTQSDGNGSFVMTVLPNPTVTARRGVLRVGSREFAVTQSAGSCSVTLEVSGSISIPASGGAGSVPIRANCPWQAAVSNGWIELTSPAIGSENAELTFRVGANSTADPRTGSINVRWTFGSVSGSRAVEIQQAAQRCAVTLSSGAGSIPSRGGSGSINVTGVSGCSWTASSAQEWLKADWTVVAGSGVVRYTAEANTSGADRVGFISIGGEVLRVQQPALSVQLSTDGIVNAASFKAGGVAPGEIVTIYGSGFGPLTLATAELTADRRALTKQLSATRVLFDGVPSPMVYTVEGQLSAVVPYTVEGKQTTSVQVEYMGVRSNSVIVPVVAAAPALFTATQSGSGQAAVLNQDYSYNGADRPAARGEIVMLYGTGEGATRPEGVDGQLAVTPLPLPVLPVTVLIGGVEARVTYAGGAPGLVAGAMQINAIVPDSVAPGPSVPVVIRVGTFESPAGVTIGVR